MKTKNLSKSFLLFAFLPSVATATPAWYRQPMLNGASLLVSCQGEGPDSSVAAIESVKNCKATAAEFLKTQIAVNSMAVQTDSDAAYHQEVSSSLSVSGLECKSTKQETVTQDGSYTNFTQCEFDISKVVVVPSLVAAQSTSLNNAHIVSTNRIIRVATVPPCDSVLVVGGKSSNIIRCNANIAQVPVGPTDSLLIVRAAGKKPYKIDLRSTPDEVFNIVLP